MSDSRLKLTIRIFPECRKHYSQAALGKRGDKEKGKVTESAITVDECPIVSGTAPNCTSELAALERVPL